MTTTTKNREATVSTPLGTVRVMAHNDASFYFGAGTRYDTGAESALVVNTVPYRISGQVAIEPSKGWTLGEIYMSRADVFGQSYTSAARKKAKQVLGESLAAWAESPEGRETLQAGEAHDVEAVRERYTEAIAELEMALRETREALEGLERGEKPATYPAWKLERRKS